MLRREQNLAIYMEGELTGDSAKMCDGILRYSPNPVVAIIDGTHAGHDVQEVLDSPRSVPIVPDVKAAVKAGADAFVLGVATPGGHIPDFWLPAIDEAVAAGLSVLNGLHDPLSPRYPRLGPDQFIWDIRKEPEGLTTGVGAALGLSNQRVLMIGTDMAIGKMTAGLEIYREARNAGINAEFIATGQIGITITGRGVPLDAVRVDYASGAIEREVMAVGSADLVIVEGQGALIHPASTANLPLIRGSCPTDFVLCHKANLYHLRRLPPIKIPPLKDYIRMYEDLAEACGTFPRPRTAGIALNTSSLGEAEAREAMARLEDEVGITVDDVVRFGTKRLLQKIRS